MVNIFIKVRRASQRSALVKHEKNLKLKILFMEKIQRFPVWIMVFRV